MSKMNTVPVIVQQTIESMLDKKTPDNVKFNNRVVLENIVEVCQMAIRKYDSYK
jgi:hypothetical protein